MIKTRSKHTKTDENEYDESNGYYTVEKLVDMKIEKGKKFFKVKWKGWPMEDCTWEPEVALKNVKNQVKSFEADYIGKNKKSNKDIIEDDQYQIDNSMLISKK